MLELKILGKELFDEKEQKFTQTESRTLSLEHSLFSLSKWESEFEKPFLSPKDKTTEEVLGYINHMIIDDSDPLIMSELTQSNLTKIQEYIDSKQSATTFGDLLKKPGRAETITSELIYFWIVSYRIPFACEHWHLNRLFALIRICNIKNSKPEKVSKNQLAERNRALNEQRKAQLNTRG